MTGIGGIHHVTAIASDPQRNLDFYAGVLGLRLMLPPQYEVDRAAIEAVLPEIHLPRPASEDSFLPAGN